MPTKLTLDRGTLAHVLFGLLGPILGYPELFTAVFCVKQVGDYLWSREEWPESAGDITEFSAGLVVGLIAKSLLGL